MALADYTEITNIEVSIWMAVEESLLIRILVCSKRALKYAHKGVSVIEQFV